jgi:hypothetical protein
MNQAQNTGTKNRTEEPMGARTRPEEKDKGGADVMDRAKDLATSIGDRAKEAASTAAQSAGQAASYVGQKAEDATSTLGGSIKSLGQTIRQKTPHGGAVGDAVANSLESAGRYIEEEGLQGMADDVTNLIRRNPVPAVLIGVGIGFLIARAMTSSRS